MLAVAVVLAIAIVSIIWHSADEYHKRTGQ